MGISTFDYVRYVWQIIGGFRLRHEQKLAALRRNDIAPIPDLNQPQRLLDVANGQLRPQYAILRSEGHHVYGVDLLNRPTQTWMDHANRVARRIFAWKLRVKPTGQTLLCGNVDYRPFPNDCFDLITSIAAFEHFLHVPLVVAEMACVLRPCGHADRTA